MDKHGIDAKDVTNIIIAFIDLVGNAPIACMKSRIDSKMIATNLCQYKLVSDNPACIIAKQGLINSILTELAHYQDRMKIIIAILDRLILF